MSSRRPKSRRRANKKRKPIPIATREEVVMYREMGLKLREICDRTNLGYGTVEYILKKARDDDDLIKRARAQALEKASSVALEKAMAALEHITPDSLTHDRVVRTDDDGNITSVQHSGPTGQQIAVTAGVLLDQAAKQQDRAAMLRGKGPEQLSPDNVKQLIASIGGRIKRLQLLDIDIDAESLQARVAQVSSELGMDNESVEVADFEEIHEDPEDE